MKCRQDGSALEVPRAHGLLAGVSHERKILAICDHGRVVSSPMNRSKTMVMASSSDALQRLGVTTTRGIFPICVHISSTYLGANSVRRSNSAGLKVTHGSRIRWARGYSTRLCFVAASCAKSASINRSSSLESLESKMLSSLDEPSSLEVESSPSSSSLSIMEAKRSFKMTYSWVGMRPRSCRASVVSMSIAIVDGV